jgi:putative acetyltransferase
MKPETPPITVRRATVADATSFVRINGDPAVLPNLLQVPYPSEEFWTQRLGEILAPGKADILLVAERPDASGQPQVVGNAGLLASGAALRRRHVMNLGIAIASDAQGQGVGSTLMKALCDWADHWGQVLRIELTVFTDNARAIALYRRFGFVQEGVHRGYALRNGAYADTYSMARLHPAQPSIGAAA